MWKQATAWHTKGPLKTCDVPSEFPSRGITWQGRRGPDVWPLLDQLSTFQDTWRLFMHASKMTLKNVGASVSNIPLSMAGKQCKQLFCSTPRVLQKLAVADRGRAAPCRRAAAPAICCRCRGCAHAPLAGCQEQEPRLRAKPVMLATWLTRFSNERVSSSPNPVNAITSFRLA